jgi:hypothetical protein
MKILAIFFFILLGLRCDAFPYWQNWYTTNPPSVTGSAGAATNAIPLLNGNGTNTSLYNFNLVNGTGNGSGITNVNALTYTGASGITFYVSPTALGNDTNSGLNVSQPFYHYWVAASNSIPGDTIVLMDGTNYFTNNTFVGVFNNIATNLGNTVFIVPPGVNIQCQNNAWVVVNDILGGVTQYADLSVMGNNIIDGLNFLAITTNTQDIALGSYNGIYAPTNYFSTNQITALQAVPFTNNIFRKCIMWFQGTGVHHEQFGDTKQYGYSFQDCQMHFNCNATQMRSENSKASFQHCEIWLGQWTNNFVSNFKPFRLIEYTQSGAGAPHPSAWSTVISDSVIHTSDADSSGSNRFCTLCYDSTGNTNYWQNWQTNVALMNNCIIDDTLTNPLSEDITPTFFNALNQCGIWLNNVGRLDGKQLTYTPGFAPNYIQATPSVSAYNSIYTNNLYVDGVIGSDTTGDGTVNRPFASITCAGQFATNNQTIVAIEGTFVSNVVSNQYPNQNIYIQLNAGVTVNQASTTFPLVNVLNASSSTVSITGSGAIITAGVIPVVQIANTTNVTVSVQGQSLAASGAIFSGLTGGISTNWGLNCSVSMSQTITMPVATKYVWAINQVNYASSTFLQAGQSIQIQYAAAQAYGQTTFPFTNNVFTFSAPTVTFSGSTSSLWNHDQGVILNPCIFNFAVTSIPGGASPQTNWNCDFRGTALAAAWPGPANSMTNGYAYLTPVGAGGGGSPSQTPWTSDINGAGYSLTNVYNLFATNSTFLTNSTSTLTATNVDIIPGLSTAPLLSFFALTNTTTGAGSWSNNGGALTNLNAIRTVTISGGTIAFASASDGLGGSNLAITVSGGSGFPLSANGNGNGYALTNLSLTNVIAIVTTNITTQVLTNSGNSYMTGFIQSAGGITNTSSTQPISSAGGVTVTGGSFTGNGTNLSNIPMNAVNWPLTNYMQGQGIINAQLREQTLYTNANFTFGLPINVTAASYNDPAIDVTNSSGSLIAITPQGLWHTTGTWNCTNWSRVLLNIIPNVITNAICVPIW